MYLLDTNIISLVAPERNRNDREEALAKWIASQSDSLYLSVITIAEIESGIARLNRLGMSRKAAAFTKWSRDIMDAHEKRILPLDIASARLAGQLFDRATGAGNNPSFSDAAIAATASTHDLVALTRNKKDFQAFQISYLDPYDALI